METTVSIDRAGRMVLPKKVREELGIEAGDTLSLISTGAEVTLRPSRGVSRMRKVRGMWVFSTGSKVMADETDRVLDEIRQGRRGL
ncbi:MAG: AbrB/MazE/SpoVT family DNA-binding domain-containing protein [Acidobacteria bacterium]|nr:AbrB/MazE/SpoVT family DNA-binding domain-containing protein [Acidobacteriota bacterium]